ncbi:DUF4231 domain-containing protein [bacterium]|nr:DUF4231 domain-containing protein [bacterium]
MSELVDASLKYTWNQYKKYAGISRKIKSKIVKFRFTVLLLTIFGAIMGTLSLQYKVMYAEGSATKVFGILSALFIGLAGYFTKDVINPELEKAWIVARSAAEAFKSEIYLYATNTQPYNSTNARQLLLDKSKELEEKISPIIVDERSDKEKKKDENKIIIMPMSVDNYITERVQDQIDFYSPKAVKNIRKINKWIKCKHILSFCAVLIGVIGGFSLFNITINAGWVAVLGTITTAITAYLYAGRFNYLSITYQSTAQKLEWLGAAWEISNKSDEAREDFIIACENVISIENRAWMVELSKKSKSIIPDSLKPKSS